MTSDLFSQEALSQRLLPWYDKHKRSLPWRLDKEGKHPDPYHVFLSEIMLQQTTVTAVIPYFLNFIQKWPTISHLGQSSLDEILHAWQGLGYYARARNMHKAAQTITHTYQGKIPSSSGDLLSLPGIGPYTAAAIQSIAFDIKAAPVDANIERILARVYALETPLPQAKKEVQDLAIFHTPSSRAGCYVQGLMDLGSLVCLSKNPNCSACPFQDICKAYQLNKAEDYPIRPTKKEKPTRYAFVFYIENEKGEILLEKRPPKGLLGGLIAFPTSIWSLEQESLEVAISCFPLNTEEEFTPFNQTVKHTFTHFHLILQPVKVKGPFSFLSEDSSYFWEKPDNFSQLAFPTLMKKVMKLFRFLDS